jgi:hypothetical protein
MDMNVFNISATLNIFRLITRPTLCLPHTTVSTFNELPIPLNKAFKTYKNVDIRAVVLDKDNCFAYPHSNTVHKLYEVISHSLQRSSDLRLERRSSTVFSLCSDYTLHLCSLLITQSTFVFSNIR